MADLQALLDSLEAKVDAETTQVQTKVASLDAKIAELQALIDAGTATPAQVEQFARLTAKVDAIDPTDSGTIGDVPPA
jgi:phage shock protein A